MINVWCVVGHARDTNKERALLKSKRGEAIAYLKLKSSGVIIYDKDGGVESLKSSVKKNERIEKLLRKGLEVASKNDSKPMTYLKLTQKLTNDKSRDDVPKIVSVLRSEIESGRLVASLEKEVSSLSSSARSSTVKENDDG